MKAKLALLKQKQETRASSGVGKSSDGYAVRKTGDGTVVLLGFPSAGKSTLLNTLTNADSPVGAYAFTTLTVIPGLLEYKFAKMQVLDVPGIVSGAASGSGRGKEVLQVIRTADFVCIVIDVFQPEQYTKILYEIDQTGVRINKEKPEIKIRRTEKNGVRIGTTVPLTDVSEEEIVAAAKMFKIQNAEILIRSQITIDDFIDTLENNKVYLPAIKILNKVDAASPEDLERARKIVKPDLEISAQKKIKIPELKDLIFDRMNFIRIFLKEWGQKADMDEPMIMQKGQTLGDLCNKLHKDFYEKFKYARIWGPSVKFDGQKVLKKTHVLGDRDIIELKMS